MSALTGRKAVRPAPEWGAGRTVEVDGAYFGGYAKPANHKENRRDRRLSRNQTGKRQCVVVIRERDGMVMPSAFPTEASALAYVRNHVALGTEIHADEASSWNDLHARYAVKRINHQLAYSDGGTHTNGAESFFSRLRRAETGHHHQHRRRLPGPLRAGERLARGPSP